MSDPFSDAIEQELLAALAQIKATEDQPPQNSSLPQTEAVGQTQAVLGPTSTVNQPPAVEPTPAVTQAPAVLGKGKKRKAKESQKGKGKKGKPKKAKGSAASTSSTPTENPSRCSAKPSEIIVPQCAPKPLEEPLPQSVSCALANPDMYTDYLFDSCIAPTLGTANAIHSHIRQVLYKRIFHDQIKHYFVENNLPHADPELLFVAFVCCAEQLNLIPKSI